MENFDFSKYRQAFADNFAQIIEARGMNPKQFAIESHTPDSTLYRYLSNSRVPKMDNLIQLALYFDVSVDWLIGLSDERKKIWCKGATEIAELYNLASPDDRKVVDAVLSKYKGL